VEQADRRREIVDVPEWVCYVVFVSADELFVCCFGCAFEACNECEWIGVWGRWEFGPHFPKNTLEFGCFGDPGGEAVETFVRLLSGGGEGEEEGNVCGVSLAMRGT